VEVRKWIWVEVRKWIWKEVRQWIVMEVRKKVYVDVRMRQMVAVWTPHGDVKIRVPKFVALSKLSVRWRTE